MLLTHRQRLIAAIGAVVMIALIGVALVLGLAVRLQRRAEPQRLATIDIALPRAPREQPKPQSTQNRAARRAPAPPNLKSDPSEIVAPPAIVPLPVIPPIVAAPIAGTSAAPTSGAAQQPGTGTGAGGSGAGTGGGGDGDGGGSPPRHVSGRLRFSDLPAALRENWTDGAVAVRYHVDMRGRVDACAVTGSSGQPELDEATCRLIQQRFRFRPSRNAAGRPVGAIIIETHRWVIEREPPSPAS